MCEFCKLLESMEMNSDSPIIDGIIGITRCGIIVTSEEIASEEVIDLITYVGLIERMQALQLPSEIIGKIVGFAEIPNKSVIWNEFFSLMHKGTKTYGTISLYSQGNVLKTTEYKSLDELRHFIDNKELENSDCFVVSSIENVILLL